MMLLVSSNFPHSLVRSDVIKYQKTFSNNKRHCPDNSFSDHKKRRILNILRIFYVK